MPGITAILHTRNDELRIARAIESLRPCDEVLVIDHASSDETLAMARRFGARVLEAQSESFDTQQHVPEAWHDWIFCMLPSEALSEGLEAALLEWKFGDYSEQSAFGIHVFEERWLRSETRLIHRASATWDQWRPIAKTRPSLLDGRLLRLPIP